MKKRIMRSLFATATAVLCFLGSATAVSAEEAQKTNNENHTINYMALVNKQNKLPDDWESNVELVKTKDAWGDPEYVEKEALSQYRKLEKSLLEEDGIDIELDSVYRSVSAQQDLWDRWTEEKGIDYVKQYVAVPGYSEHHTGLAIDICLKKGDEIIDSNEKMIADTETFSKIHSKIADYGFILRYLDGKDEITGYSYEPWHLRYIGNSSIAKDIMERNLTFEEYLDERYEGMPDSPEWIAKLGEKRKTSQIVVIAGVKMNTAYVSMHEKTPSGKWVQVMSTPGYIGKKGLGKTKEGDYKTPVGTFHFNQALGIADDPGVCTSLKYKKATNNTWWSSDARFKYNQMVNIKDFNKEFPGEELDGEHIVYYESEYQYCLNISYNEECTPGLGNAIFLHCTGYKKPYTGGCVAIPREKMETVMKYVKPDCVVEINSLKKLSPETWNEWDL